MFVENNQTASRYAKGQKYCRTCATFKIWEGLFCPDCGYRLRVSPVRRLFKEKLRERS
jgi:hypothetical protein